MLADHSRQRAALFAKTDSHGRDDVGVADGDGAAVRFDEKPRVAFFLAGDDVIHDHGTAGGDRFLHGGAAGFADEEMAGAQKPRQLFAPADNLERARREAADVFNRFAHASIASDGDG